MNFNLKQLLTLAVFFGSVSCSTVGKDGLIEKIEKGKGKIEKFGENSACKNMIYALKNPNCFIKSNYEFEDNNTCKDEHAHDFYRIIFKDDKEGKKLETFSVHCKTHENVDGLDADITKAVTEAYEEKKKFLTEIVKKIPIVSDYAGTAVTDDFDVTIKSHIDKFIDDALVFDGKRLTFSNLHKTVESIKNAYEVERKATAGVEAALAMLKDPKAKFETLNSTNAFRIKKANTESGNKKDDAKKKESETKKEPEQKVEKPKNIVKVAIKASDKSTSSPLTLGFVLGGSLVISLILLAFKAYTAEEVKDDEEEEQH